jgi:hypothetical protein
MVFGSAIIGFVDGLHTGCDLSAYIIAFPFRFLAARQWFVSGSGGCVETYFIGIQDGDW